MPAADLMSISGPESVKAAHNMSEMWSTFARTGRRQPRASRMAGVHDGKALDHGDRRGMRGRRTTRIRWSESLWERLDP